MLTSQRRRCSGTSTPSVTKNRNLPVNSAGAYFPNTRSLSLHFGDSGLVAVARLHADAGRLICNRGAPEETSLLFPSMPTSHVCGSELKKFGSEWRSFQTSFSLRHVFAKTRPNTSVEAKTRALANTGQNGGSVNVPEKVWNSQGKQVGEKGQTIWHKARELIDPKKTGAHNSRHAKEQQWQEDDDELGMMRRYMERQVMGKQSSKCWVVVMSGAG